MNIEDYIDHTLLHPTATPEDIRTLCDEAKKHQFHAVCVNGCHVALAKTELNESQVKVVAVVGFPLGAMSTASKIHESRQCINDGANEIDMVINIGLLKSFHYDLIEAEIKGIKKAIGSNVLKVILETCYLSQEEIIIASQIAINAKADFIKTSTGFGTAGARLEDVKSMQETARDQIQIKASGGIKDRATAEQYIALGVTRIGTSSGINIVSNP
jgi:deoxyribose-phosphate aldolase